MVMRKVPQLPFAEETKKFDRKSPTKSPTSGLTFRIGNGRQQRHFGAARIEPRVLHDDRNVRFEHRGVVGVARDRLRVVEIVEAQMQRAPGGDGHAVRADRLPVGEEDGNGDARVLLAGVEDAGGLVGNERAVGKRAFGGNVAFRDCPSSPSDGLHAVPPFFPTRMLTRTTRFSFRPQELFFASSVEMSSMAFAGKADDGVPSKRRVLYRGQRPATPVRANRGAGCAQSPFRPASPTRRGSRISPTRRNRTGPSWCARWRSACAGPIAKSSMGDMALPLPASSVLCSAMNRWARWKRRLRGAGLRPAISSSGSCAGLILCRASRAPPAR